VAPLSIVIREVDGLEEGDTIEALHKETLPLDVIPPPEVGRWWLAYDGEAPIAFAGMKPSSGWVLTTYLHRCGVLRSYRGLGLQRRLIRARIVAARRQGDEWALTDTNFNPASSNNLIACGFRLYEPAKPYGFETTLYWRRRL
jgi:GNAT superfamily N-acetyltransferase